MDKPRALRTFPPMARPPVFLDPKNDWAFKRIFGSRQSTGVLTMLLNDLLFAGAPGIAGLEIIEPYLPSQVRHLKDSAVDVLARLSDGSEVLIEMQMLPVAGYRSRVLYNGAKRLTAQLGRGHDYLKLRPVTVITIADCTLLPDTPAWLSHYALQEKTSRQLYGDAGLDLIFLELPKADELAIPPAHPLREWIDFLKNALSWSTIPHRLKNAGVREALRLSRQDALSPAEAEVMSKRQLYKIDQKNILLAAKLEGRAIGEAEGLALGEARGEARAKSEGARNFLKMGLKPEQIAEAMKMPLEEVMALAAPAPAPARRGKAGK